jgi:flagellar motor switch protein FliM
MENILTKEEIEALLTAVFEGRIDPDRELARVEGEVTKYDLFSTNAYKGFVPNMDLIYEGYIRFNRVTLSNRLRKMVEIRKSSARAYKFDEFLQTLPSPVCMAIFKIDPLKGAALLALDSTLVFSVVDSILGGAGNPKLPEGDRMFTSIELKLMEKLVKDILQDMEKAWMPLIASHMNLIKIEMNPRLVNIVPPEYQVVATTLEIQIEQVVGTMTVVVPYMTIDPIRDKLKSGSQYDLMAVDPEWAKRLSRELQDVPLELVVELGSSVITLQELLNLTPGDTILLNTTHDNDLSITVGGIQKFMGAPGVRHGNKAIRVTEVLRHDGEAIK